MWHTHGYRYLVMHVVYLKKMASTYACRLRVWLCPELKPIGNLMYDLAMGPERLNSWMTYVHDITRHRFSLKRYRQQLAT